MDSEGTLWDQDDLCAALLPWLTQVCKETHENAIRILVEEAKVNLCLRSVGAVVGASVVFKFFA